jgi:hypothetical protein
MRWLDDADIDLDSIREGREIDRYKAAAYKTVDIFSGIVGRRLLLVPGDSPATDTQRIFINFKSPNYYQDIEHELAHILFQSDPIACAMFVEEYTDRVLRALKKAGVKATPQRKARLAKSLHTIINITEDHRINSLWGLLYPGSYAIIREQDRASGQRALSKAHESIVSLYFVVATGLDPEPGELDRFRAYCVEALSKVELRGFDATLMIAKWLIGCFVSEIVRQEKNLPSPEPPKGSPTTCEDSGGEPGQGGRPLWSPEAPKSSQKERAEALSKLINQMGELPKEVDKKVSDVEPPKTPAIGSTEKARGLKNAAMKLDIHKEDVVAASLEQSQADMADVVKNVMQVMSGNMSRDHWIRKEIGARVVFKDVRARDVVGYKKTPLSPEDQLTIRRLRAVFNRVMGRRKSILEDSGGELDISAFIERKMTGHPVPCFRQEVRGRGFKVIILLDRSGSMYSHKAQTERACRVIFKSLAYPFVDLAIWGFNSLDDGQIDICRYNPKLEVFDSDKSKLGGFTPLHLAVRVGARYLEVGAESKHMIVATDGYPVYSRGDGKHYGSEQLMNFVREDVRRVQKRGVNVTGVIFGEDPDKDEDENYRGWGVKNSDMAHMFGPRRNWRRIEPDRMGQDLVKLVSSSFLNYLRTG